MYENMCPNCFTQLEKFSINDKCPNCDFDLLHTNERSALSSRFVLAERFVVGIVKSINSESIYYKGYDTKLNKKVIIREFFPTPIADRYEFNVVARQGKDLIFQKMYNDFMFLAKSLLKIHKFDAILPVFVTFAQNNTFYIVYEENNYQSLETFIKERGTLSFDETKELFKPLLNTLEKIHLMGIVHLGISPKTLRISDEGKLLLTEFTIEAYRHSGMRLKPHLPHGTSAYEQYFPEMPCNQMADIYAVASNILFCMTGSRMMDSSKRILNPKLMFSKEFLTDIPDQAISAISSALQIKPEDRCANMENFNSDFLNENYSKDKIIHKDVVTSVPKFRSDTKKRHIPPFVWLASAFVISFVVFWNIGMTMANNGSVSVSWIFDFMDEFNNSNATQVIKVPKLSGQYYKDVYASVKNNPAYHFTLEVESSFSETVEEGKIISQSPKEDVFMPYGDTIKVVVSKGSKTRYLPKINGLPLEDAKEALEKQGLKLVPVPSYSKDVKIGYILWYVGEYNSGDKVEYGSEIEVYVSTGS